MIRRRVVGIQDWGMTSLNIWSLSGRKKIAAIKVETTGKAEIMNRGMVVKLALSANLNQADWMITYTGPQMILTSLNFSLSLIGTRRNWVVAIAKASEANVVSEKSSNAAIHKAKLRATVFTLSSIPLEGHLFQVVWNALWSRNLSCRRLSELSQQQHKGKHGEYNIQAVPSKTCLKLAIRFFEFLQTSAYIDQKRCLLGNYPISINQ